MLLALFVAKKEGLSAEEAIRKVREVRPLAITAPGWKVFALAGILLLSVGCAKAPTEFRY